MKKLINGTEQTMNLAPIRYTWGWNLMEDMMANFWLPNSIGMGGDKQCYELEMTEDEKHVFYTMLATLTTSDIAIGQNAAINLYEKITAPEVQCAIGLQIQQECIHSAAYQHILESIGFNQDHIYSLYYKIPEIKQKFDLATYYYDNTLHGNTLSNNSDIKNFLRGLFFYYGVWEGAWFSAGFIPFFALARTKKMARTKEQITYIRRDELTSHVPLGMKLIIEIQKETGVYLTQEDINSICNRTYESEKKFASYVVRPLLGYDIYTHLNYFKYELNRRCHTLKLSSPFLDVTENPLPWLSEMADLRKEVNFFEGRVQEYTQGRLNFDENSPIDEVANWRN